ncbi:hypothetical protein FOZ62_000435, partial [Perkinsus olseni]
SPASSAATNRRPARREARRLRRDESFFEGWDTSPDSDGTGADAAGGMSFGEVCKGDFLTARDGRSPRSEVSFSGPPRSAVSYGSVKRPRKADSNSRRVSFARHPTYSEIDSSWAAEEGVEDNDRNSSVSKLSIWDDLNSDSGPKDEPFVEPVRRQKKPKIRHGDVMDNQVEKAASISPGSLHKYRYDPSTVDDITPHDSVSNPGARLHFRYAGVSRKSGRGQEKLSEDVCMSGASEEDIKACIMALARLAPVDDESQWLPWLEDLAHHVEGAAVATTDSATVKSWVVEAIQQPAAEQSKYRDDYEVAVFRPCILYSIHRAIVKARHCFGTPTENSDASSLSGSATGELVEASDQKLGTPPSYSCHPLNDEDDHLPAADASRPSQEWDCLMQMMPERSSEAEEWLPWKEALRDGLNEEGQEADGLTHAPKVRSLINLCGLDGLWCAAWRRILMDDLITPMVALGCRKDFNVAVLGPLLR